MPQDRAEFAELCAETPTGAQAFEYKWTDRDRGRVFAIPIAHEQYRSADKLRSEAAEGNVGSTSGAAGLFEHHQQCATGNRSKPTRRTDPNQHGELRQGGASHVRGQWAGHFRK